MLFKVEEEDTDHKMQFWQTAASDNIPAITLLSLGCMTALNQSNGMHACTQIFIEICEAKMQWLTAHTGLYYIK